MKLFRPLKKVNKMLVIKEKRVIITIINNNTENNQIIKSSNHQKNQKFHQFKINEFVRSYSGLLKVIV